MQHALIQMNLHLHKVINDITGLTGMSIIRTIVAGERDPQTLAALKNSRIRSSHDETQSSQRQLSSRIGVCFATGVNALRSASTADCCL